MPAQRAPVGTLKAWWRRNRHWLWPVLFGLLTAGCGVAVLLLGDAAAEATKRGVKHRDIAWAAGFVAIPVVVGAVAEAVRSRRVKESDDLIKDLEVQFNNTLGDFIAPLADVIGCIAAATVTTERNRLRGQLEAAIVNAAVTLCGEGRTRAAFYHARKNASGRIISLERRAWHGRSTEPRSLIKENGVSRANAILEFARSDEFLFVEDTDEETFAAEYVVKDYKTFICVSVKTSNVRHGILVIDAPTPGDLIHPHSSVMRALAKLLAAGLSD